MWKWEQVCRWVVVMGKVEKVWGHVNGGRIMAVVWGSGKVVGGRERNSVTNFRTNLLSMTF